jgi:hypothetical protein
MNRYKSVFKEASVKDILDSWSSGEDELRKKADVKAKKYITQFLKACTEQDYISAIKNVLKTVENDSSWTKGSFYFFIMKLYEKGFIQAKFLKFKNFAVPAKLNLSSKIYSKLNNELKNIPTGNV